MQKRFVLDLNLCTGCQACRIACHIENETDIKYTWRQIVTFNPDHHPELPLFHLSLACNHCIDPPCMKGCPAAAYTKDPITGAVTIDAAKCIGCKYCLWTCPYDAPKYNEVLGTVEKCNFCEERLDEKREPACVELCPTHALTIEDWKDDQFLHVPGFPKTKEKPAIRFIPLKEKSYIPDHTPLPFDAETIELFENSAANSRRKTGLRTEWTLLFFTFIAALLTGLFAAAIEYPLLISNELFLGAGIAAMTASTLHLGKRERAFRAIANIGKSWLSREILFFSLFLFFAAISFYLLTDGILLRWLTALFGFLALLSIDKVYEAAYKKLTYKLHSAQTILTGFFVYSLISGDFIILGTTASIKLTLYVYRKIEFHRKSQPVNIKLTAIRILVGFIIPLILLLVDPIEHYIEMIVSALLGELIDRIEFYKEFDIITPEYRKDQDMELMLEELRKPGDLGL